MGPANATKPPVLKVVPVEVNSQFSPDEGWTMRELVHAIVDGRVQFYAVLLQMPAMPKVATPPSKPAIIK